MLDVTFCTARNSKGLKWDIVNLLDDFLPKVGFDYGPSKSRDDEQASLLYLAVTRARKSLGINPACYYTLLGVGDRRERFVDTQVYLEDVGVDTQCVYCDKDLPGNCSPRTASLITHPLRVLAAQDILTEGVSGILCSFCAGNPHYMSKMFNCYQHEWENVFQFRFDNGHLAFRFLVGPKPEELERVSTTYMKSGFAFLVAQGTYRSHTIDDANSLSFDKLYGRHNFYCVD